MKSGYASVSHHPRLWRPVFALLLWAGLVAASVSAAPPARFAVEDVLTEIEQPMSLRFLPDGRMLLIQKKGQIRIVNTSTTPATSALYLNLGSSENTRGIQFDQERGLIDIAVDPNFPAQPYIYLFYTPRTGPNGGRASIARFTHRENSGGLTSRGDLSTQVILWEDTHGYDRCCHFGGGLDFGPDGKLWLTTGDHFQGHYAASLAHAGGGVIRINKDGTIPADNPYIDGNGPNHDALFAYGLRNPFRARWDIPSGRFFIAEVGGNEQAKAWEDLHVIEYDHATGRFIDDDFGTANDDGKFSGINFGWPTVEGFPPYTDFPGANIDRVGQPLFAYSHDGNHAAINGGVVYRGSMFPAEYQGAYFYADSTRDFIRFLKFKADGSLLPNPNPAPIDIKNPETISYPFDLYPRGRVVALEVGPDGALYYVNFTDQGGAYGVPNPSDRGGVRRYVYDAGNARPEITRFTAQPTTGASPLTVQFTLSALDPERQAMTYVIDYGDGNTSGAPRTLANGTTTTISHTYTRHGMHEARLMVTDGTHTVNQSITVRVGNPPVITSFTSTNHRASGTGTSFRYGDTFTLTASATDPEDGTLGGARFTWSISFVRPGNVHPVQGPETGSRTINFAVPNQGQGFSGNVFYRVSLTVTDSSGLEAEGHIDILPEKADIAFQTIPAGIMVQVDGNTELASPFVLDTLINFEHTISVPPVVCVEGEEYRFSHWSNGPTTPQQAYVVPPQNSSLTAHYTQHGSCAAPPSEGLVLRLTGSAGVVTSGTRVLAWEDQSHLGNDLSALGAPTYVPNELNGQSYIRFNAGNDAVRRTSFTGLPTGNAARSVFMMVRYHAADASTGGWAGFAYGTRTTNGAFGLTLTPQGHLGVQGWGTAHDVVASPPTVVTGPWLTHAAVYQNGVLHQFHNGAPAGITNRSYSTGNGSIWLGEELGGGKNLRMDVAEVLVYDRALSENERQRIETYFQTRYHGTPNTAPAVTILSPEHLAQISAAQMPITLQGSALDQEEGNISSRLRWSSSRDGDLGTGSQRSVTLSVGTHVLRARAADQAGLEGSDEITVTVSAAGGTGLITHGLVLHLESDLNVSTASGNRVAGWLDQSGLGNDLVAAGAPVLAAGATPTGRSAIRLNGTSDRLERIHATDALGALPTGNANRSMFVVTRYTSASAWGGVAYGTGASNRAFGLGVRAPGGQLVLQGWGSGNDLTSNASGVGAGWLIQAGVLNNGSATLFKDGSQVASFSHTYNTTLTKLVIGQEISGAGHIGMEVAAVLLYDRSLGVDERRQVESYLRDKYLASSRPTVTITAPADGAGFWSGATVTFQATATDPQQGDLAATVDWSSSRDGALGRGASLSVNTLTTGTHTITATVVGNAQQVATDQIVVSIGANTPPTVTISAPADQATFAAGASVTFTATAQDQQDGNVSNSLTWSSDRDGNLGTGASVTRSNLSVGTHVITATATDSAGASGTAQRTLTITAPPSTGLPVSGGLVLHLEGDSGVSTSGSTVSGWSDLSPQGNHLVASGGPIRVGAATPAGRAAVRLDGVDDYLERLHSTHPLKGFPTGNANRTLFVVARYQSTTWWGGVSYGQASSNRAFGVGVKHPTGEQFLQGYGSTNDMVSTTPGLGAGWIVQAGLHRNGVARLYSNGSVISQRNRSFSTSLNRLVIGQEIGRTGYIGMEVAAVLLYDRALTDAEISQVNTYLTQRFLAAAPNTAPSVQISSPADGASFSAGSGIQFTGTATDAEEGDLSATLAWQSSRDGALGTGGSLQVQTLSVGQHTITATSTDRGGLSGQATVQITVASAPATLPVTSGLVLRLEATDGVTTTGSTVTEWADLSGRNNHVFASGGPTLAAGLTPKGRPAIRLDGTDDKLERVHATHPLSGLPTGNGNRTVFAIVRYHSSTWWGGIAYGTPSANRTFGIGIKHPSGELVLQGYGAANDLVSTTPGIGAGWIVQGAVQENGVASLLRDNNPVAQANRSFNTSLTRLRIGEEIGGLGFIGMDVAAILIYNRALTPAERSSVVQYLRQQYLD
jgi:glucose/arabinose dehydrogenase